MRIFIYITLFMAFSGLAYHFYGDYLFNLIFDNKWLLCLLVWNIYALIEARREAMYFSLKSRSRLLDKYNEHPMFSLQRGLALVLIGSILNQFWPVILLALMFPFIHDGFYYYLRDNLDSAYPKRWLANPKKSTAFFDIVFRYPLVRILVFIGSLITYIWIR